MEQLVEKIAGLIWSDIFILLCVFTGIYFSIRLGFPQFTQVREMLRLLFQEKEILLLCWQLKEKLSLQKNSVNS